MILQPTLKGKLVLLRPLKESDLEPLYEVAKDPLIWEQHPCPTRYQRAEYEAFFKDSLDSQGALIVIDAASDQVIGSSRFNPIERHSNAVEIGWSFLARKYWGGKYNRAVKKLMISHALETLDCVIFYIGRDNVRSQKAVEKLGAIKIIDSLNPLMKISDIDITYKISSQI